MKLADLLRILDLERLEVKLFRGQSHPTAWGRVYGGQVLAQALLAAMATVPDDRKVHSLHGYFILGGDTERPIIYDVDELRDGRSFTTRRVTAHQKGAAIFTASASFQRPEQSVDHQLTMPDVPAPETLPTRQQTAERYRDRSPRYYRTLSRELPMEIRPVTDYDLLSSDPLPATYRAWMRTAGNLPDDDRLHRAVLAYASDFHLLTTAVLPHLHEVSFAELMITSLDHAMWFHQDFRADEWLLFDIDAPQAGGGRGFTRGSIYKQSGELVCSIAQEGLVRRLTTS